MKSNPLPRGANSLGNTLLTHLATKSNSGSALILSPWGLSHALALLLEGAAPNSDSYQQIQNALFSHPESSLSRQYINSAVKSLSDSITASSDGEDLTVSDACSVFAKPGVQLLDVYVRTIRLYFNAEAQPLTSAAVVNAWVNKETRGKIKTIVNDGMVQSMAVLLVNAIYFKGLWQAPFQKRQTRQWDFNLLDGSQMETPMMFLHKKNGTELQGARFKAQLPSGSTIPCVAAKMAYKGGTYSAIVAIPEGEVISSEPPGSLTLENGQIYAEALAACRKTVLCGLTSVIIKENKSDSEIEWEKIGSPGMAGIRLYLPRFEVEFEAHLCRALTAAGLGAIFNAGDFTNMTASGEMEVSDVIQKVYVKADESGTEAAAVTAVVKRCAMGRNRPPPPPELIIRCDRPFVFTILHEASGLALFAGEIYKPEQWKEEDTSSSEKIL